VETLSFAMESLDVQALDFSRNSMRFGSRLFQGDVSCRRV
jgi:hypothetical protein